MVLDEMSRPEYGSDMEVTLRIPDDIAAHLSEGGVDLSRRALESMAADEYRNGRLTKPELQRLLGIETSFQFDGL